MGRPEQPAELYLAISSGDTVRCRVCGSQVDFGLSCELVRSRDGRLHVSRCHACLIAVREAVGPALPLEAWELMRDLVETLGTEGAKREIGQLLQMPLPGSRWVYTCPRTGGALEFCFVRSMGALLQFSGPFGAWECSRDHWAAHLAAHRVRALAVNERTTVTRGMA